LFELFDYVCIDDLVVGVEGGLVCEDDDGVLFDDGVGEVIWRC